MLTCTDNQSRNRRFGYALGQGQSAEHAQQAIGQVVEGRLAVGEIMNLARKLEIDLPISAQVEAVLLGRCAPEQAVSRLLAREPKQENA
jgi:glycerol-3-phosphate dehydrogenase (NAD(P)+)